MTRIATSTPTQKAGRVRDKPYLGYIGALGGEQGAGCLSCIAMGRPGTKPCQVCHFRGGRVCPDCGGAGVQRKFTAPPSMTTRCHPCLHCKQTGWRYGKPDAIKHDRFTWPGCPSCHQYAKDAQHAGSEYTFWRESRRLDVLRVMHELQAIYDTNPLPLALEKGTALILEVRK